jgi:protein TonB
LPAPPSISLAARLVADEPRVPAAEPEDERIAVPTPLPPRERKRPAAVAPSQPVGNVGRESGVDVADPTYYGARQLDVFPALASPFELRYPRPAAADVKGRVALLVLIDAKGSVNEVSVVDAQPAGYFEEDALRLFRAARFTPAFKNGRAVKSRIVIEVSYGKAAP